MFLIILKIQVGLNQSKFKNLNPNSQKKKKKSEVV